MTPAEAIARAAVDALGFLAFALLLTYLLVLAFRCSDGCGRAVELVPLTPAEAQ